MKKNTKIKNFINDHKNKIEVGAIVSGLVIISVTFGIFIGETRGYVEGYNDCNDSWYNFWQETFKIKKGGKQNDDC